jgi:putative pyruvate formate lyase activating enzyme
VSWPAYVDLFSAGELAQRARSASLLLVRCRLCPRRCGADRWRGRTGVCGVGASARVASYGPHHGEERCLSGFKGSGTIFFSGCNLGCVFCQNWEISHGRRNGRLEGDETSADELAEMMLELQGLGCHNINFVTPSHVVPQILEALAVAVPEGLRLPLVYNTSGYDAVETLRLLDGVVDVYMPDFKYWDEEAAARDLTTADYPDAAREAVAEMHRQVGDLALDGDGLARRGLLVRHLVMPGMLDQSREIFAWLARLSPDTAVNVLAQYHPEGLAAWQPGDFPDLSRRVSRSDYEAARNEARQAGLRRAARL